MRSGLALVTNETATGWSDAEINLLDRLAGVLMRRNVTFEYTLGRAEDGTPWAAFTGSNTGITLYHFARTADGYVVFGECVPPREHESLIQLVLPIIGG
jgi:hypothetical protein